jgi:hypothetical protein
MLPQTRKNTYLCPSRFGHLVGHSLNTGCMDGVREAAVTVSIATADMTTADDLSNKQKTGLWSITPFNFEYKLSGNYILIYSKRSESKFTWFNFFFQQDNYHVP